MLLINFLNELLYFAESEGLAFDQFDLQIKGDQLIGQITGAKIEAMAKEIKAATFHNLKVSETNQGITVNIVFDV
jgi:SHS2 domain-containing protein